MTRDHSFLRNAEFWAEPQNMPFSAEFLCFNGILLIRYWPVIQGTNTAYFGGVQAAVLYVHRVREKKRPRFSRHNFDKFRRSFVIFGTHHRDTSAY